MKKIIVLMAFFASNVTWAACRQSYQAYGDFPSDYICINLSSKDEPVGNISCKAKHLVIKLIGEVEDEVSTLTDDRKIREAGELKSKLQSAVDNCTGASKTPLLDRWFSGS